LRLLGVLVAITMVLSISRGDFSSSASIMLGEVNTMKAEREKIKIIEGGIFKPLNPSRSDKDRLRSLIVFRIKNFIVDSSFVRREIFSTDKVKCSDSWIITSFSPSPCLLQDWFSENSWPVTAAPTVPEFHRVP
jgi:hypothetical protein